MQKTNIRGAAAEAPQETKQIPVEEGVNNLNRQTQKPALPPTLHPPTTEEILPTNRTDDPEGGIPIPTGVATGNHSNPETDATSLWLCSHS